MPAADPALGLSGAMAREQPRVGAEPVGAGELARAARSLESVQGNVAGQTMAIQSLSMSTQSAVLNVGAQMNALSSQLASLNSSIARLSGGMAIASMPPPPPMMAMGGGGGFQMPSMAPFAGAAGRAGMGMMAGLGAIGTGLGYMGGSMMGPIMGNVPVTRTAYGAEMSSGASAYQAAMLASGVGVSRGTMRNMNYDRATSAGRERFGDMVGHGAMSAIGGAASLGTGLMGDFIGSRMILPAMGYSGSGIVGSLAGSLVGSAAMLPVSMGIQETMRQTAQISQLGDQYGRNAYRMGGGRPGRGDRGAFGRAGLDVAIQDMTLTSQDVTDITAGMFNNDLTRGVRGTSEASDRLRELSRSVKTMARTLGGSYGEMMQTAGELQSIGMNINPQNTRRAVFGASSVFGMTGKEGMVAGMNLAQPFVGMGLGSQGFGMGLMNQNLANYSIQSGGLNSGLTAAVGGREGAAALMQRGNLNFLQGPAGMAMLAGGMNANGTFSMGNVAGRGMNDMLGRGGAMANQQNLLELAVAPQRLMAEAMKNPEALLARQLQQTQSMAEGMGITSDTGKMAMFGVQTGLQGAELEAAWAMAKESPEAASRKSREMAKAARAAQRSDIAEQGSITGKIKRGAASFFQPASNQLSKAGEIFGTGGEDFSNWIGRGLDRNVRGIESVQLTGAVTAEDMAGLSNSLRDRGAGSVMSDEQMMTTPTSGATGTVTGVADENAKRAERNALRKELREKAEVTDRSRTLAAEMMDSSSLDSDDKERIQTIKAQLASETDPATRARLVKEALALSTGGTYDSLSADRKGSRQARAAIRERLGQELGGINVASELLNAASVGSFSAVTKAEESQLDDDVETIQEILEGKGIRGMSNDKIKETMSGQGMQEYLKASTSGASPAKLRKMREKLSGDELKMAEALTGLNATDAAVIKRATGTQRKASAAKMTMEVGAQMASAIGEAGGDTTLFGSKSIEDVISGMSSGAGLSKEQLEKIRGTVDDKMFAALSLSGDPSRAAENKEALDVLVGSTRAAELMENGLVPQEILSATMEGLSAGEVGGVTAATMENAATTGDQASILLAASTEQKRLAMYTIELANIVAKIKGK